MFSDKFFGTRLRRNTQKSAGSGYGDCGPVDWHQVAWLHVGVSAPSLRHNHNFVGVWHKPRRPPRCECVGAYYVAGAQHHLHDVGLRQRSRGHESAAFGQQNVLLHKVGRIGEHHYSGFGHKGLQVDYRPVVVVGGAGVAWANSLFEDNAEYGFGMAVA